MRVRYTSRPRPSASQGGLQARDAASSGQILCRGQLPRAVVSLEWHVRCDVRPPSREQVLVKLGMKTEEECAVPEGEGSESVMEKIKCAGRAGIVSYIIWEVIFWFTAIPIACFTYYSASGSWPDFSIDEDKAKVPAFPTPSALPDGATPSREEWLTAVFVAAAGRRLRLRFCQRGAHCRAAARGACALDDAVGRRQHRQEVSRQGRTPNKTPNQLG